MKDDYKDFFSKDRKKSQHKGAHKLSYAPSQFIKPERDGLAVEEEVVSTAIFNKFFQK